MLTRRRIIAAAIEAVEGVAEAITATDAGILAIDPKFDPDIKMYERSNIKLNTLSKLEPIPGQQMGTISFKAELKGPGATYSATVKPALGKYLRACGFAETVDTTAGAEKVTYLPASTGAPSITLWLYEDGMVHKLYGARGTVSFSGKIGEPIFADFKFSGIYEESSVLAMITPTLEMSRPPVMLNTALAIGGHAAVYETLSIDMGNDVQMRPDANSETGYLSAMITDRKPTGKLDPEMVLPATYDFLGNWRAGTPAVLSMGPIGNVNYNRYTIGAPKCTTTKVGSGERGGLSTADLDMQLCMNTGDDEFKLEFVK